MRALAGGPFKERNGKMSTRLKRKADKAASNESAPKNDFSSYKKNLLFFNIVFKVVVLKKVNKTFLNDFKLTTRFEEFSKIRDKLNNLINSFPY